MKFGILETPELVPCVVLDTHGLRVCFPVRGDTETGECEILLPGHSPCTHHLTQDGNSPLRVKVTLARPLRLEPPKDSTEEERAAFMRALSGYMRLDDPVVRNEVHTPC